MTRTRLWGTQAYIDIAQDNLCKLSSTSLFSVGQYLSWLEYGAASRASGGESRSEWRPFGMAGRHPIDYVLTTST